MKNIKLHIDCESYISKPTSEDYTILKTRLQNNKTIQDIELSKLMKLIGKGYSVSPSILINGMTANNWTEQTLFMIDIDNNDESIPMLSVNNAIDICKNNNLQPAFYYYTFSHSKNKPKFRIAFIMDKPVKDNMLRETIITTLIRLFPQSDSACKNADRIFLGTDKQVVPYNTDARISADDILKLATPQIANNHHYNSEIDRLKNEFNLLDYMCKDNEISKQTSDIVYFKNCSICGHNDCLRYYPNTNTFYCFGANGTIGGSIIDYLMASEKLSLEQAINKLKELCKVNSNDMSSKLEYISAKDLQSRELKPVKFYVNEIIPQGLNLLCSVPKLGKSWFALQLCLSISQGQKFLEFDTEKSSCLYLALEDSYNRIKSRTNKLLNGDDAPSNLYFNIYNNNLNNGLIDELTMFISKYPDVKVIVIDTLQKIRGISKSSNVYADDYKDLSLIKTFADKNDLCILLVHHLKKGSSDIDVFERVSGTNGITGSADTTLVLSKKNRYDIETSLSIVGRDVELNNYTIKFNKELCKWEMINNLNDIDCMKNEYNNNTLIKTIKHLLDIKDIWQGTLKEINHEHKKLFQTEYAHELKIKKDIEKYKSFLFNFDKIEYIPADKSPKNKGRIQTLKKIK